jgi:hypothetical protein
VADVYITLSTLEQVVTELEAITAEFDNAKNNSEALEAAIGKPFGKGELRDRAEDFESRWDDKRSQLNDGLKGIKDHVKGVVDTVQQWDADTAIALEG